MGLGVEEGEGVAGGNSQEQEEGGGIYWEEAEEVGMVPTLLGSNVWGQWLAVFDRCRVWSRG